MRTHTPRATLARLILAALRPAGTYWRCSCGVYYDPSNPADACAHNNH